MERLNFLILFNFLIFFGLAINDIVTAVPDGISCSLYIEDFVLYLSGSTLPSTFRLMQLAINNVLPLDLHRNCLFSVKAILRP